MAIADWVYFEEIFNRRWPAFWWSPDSKRIAFMEFDDAGVGTLTMLDDTQEPRKVEQNKYPRSGEPNPKVRLGIVERERRAGAVGRPVRLFVRRVPDQRGRLVARQLAAYGYVQDRTQTWLDLVKIAADDPQPEGRNALFRDTTKAWIDDPGRSPS